MKDVADVMAGIRVVPPPSRQDTPESAPTSQPNDESVETLGPPLPTPVEEDYWQKFTLPLRADQLQALNDILAQWGLSLRVKITVAETVRLALDQLLERIQTNPDQVLLELYEQEQREQHKAPGRKGGAKRGLERHLRRQGHIP